MARIENLERIMRQHGISISSVCRKAKISRRIFFYWKKGSFSPNTRTIEKFENALKALVRKAENHK